MCCRRGGGAGKPHGRDIGGPALSPLRGPNHVHGLTMPSCPPPTPHPPPHLFPSMRPPHPLPQPRFERPPTSAAPHSCTHRAVGFQTLAQTPQVAASGQVRGVQCCLGVVDCLGHRPLHGYGLVVRLVNTRTRHAHKGTQGLNPTPRTLTILCMEPPPHPHTYTLMANMRVTLAMIKRMPRSHPEALPRNPRATLE